MINVLIVDDSATKCQDVEASIRAWAAEDQCGLEVAPDLVSARRLLQSNRFDCLILDLQLPNRFSQKPGKGRGLDLLGGLISGRYLIPNYIIGLTEFESEALATPAETREILWGVLLYDQASDEWAHSLRVKLEHVMRMKGSGEEHHHVARRFPVAIVCALEEVELDAIRRMSSSWKELSVPGDSALFYEGLLENGGRRIPFIAGSPGQMGLSAMCSYTTRIITYFRPERMFLTGIMGGVKGAVNLGDVVVADPCWDYGSGKYGVENGEDIFKPEPRQERVDDRILRWARILKTKDQELARIKGAWQGSKPDTELKLHIGPLASGAGVLANAAKLEEVTAQNRKLLGIDMEAYGFLFSARNSAEPKPLALVIKAVSDFSDASKSDDLQSYCSYVSAHMLRTMLFDNPD